MPVIKEASSEQSKPQAGDFVGPPHSANRLTGCQFGEHLLLVVGVVLSDKGIHERRVTRPGAAVAANVVLEIVAATLWVMEYTAPLVML